MRATSGSFWLKICEIKTLITDSTRLLTGAENKQHQNYKGIRQETSTIGRNIEIIITMLFNNIYLAFNAILTKKIVLINPPTASPIFVPNQISVQKIVLPKLYIKPRYSPLPK